VELRSCQATVSTPRPADRRASWTVSTPPACSRSRAPGSGTPPLPIPIGRAPGPR